MPRPIPLCALVALILATTGCSNPFQRTVSVHVTADGHDRLYSQIRMDAHRADFRCLASDTGTCHYTVYTHPCHGHDECTASILRRFDIPTGKKLLDATLPEGYAACVSQDPNDLGNACPRIR